MTKAAVIVAGIILESIDVTSIFEIGESERKQLSVCILYVTELRNVSEESRYTIRFNILYSNKGLKNYRVCVKCI